MSVFFRKNYKVEINGHHSVNCQPYQNGDIRWSVHWILLDWIVKNAIETDRCQWSEEKVDKENDSLGVGFVKAAQISNIPSSQNNHQIDHCENMNYHIECMHCTGTKFTASFHCRADEKPSMIQIEDDDDVKQDKKHRAKDNWEKDHGKVFERAIIFEYIKHAQNNVKQCLSDIIPVCITICMDNPFSKKKDTKSQSIKCHQK